MATQHPDNASVPWWRDNAFIPTQDEIEELTVLFEQLPIDEYMWDWEGKYVDEAVGEKLFSRAGELFAKRPLGEELHLTYRIPAFDGQKMHRMARAFMNILSLADLSRDIGLKRPVVTEMYLPLTTSADQPMKVRETFKKVMGYHRDIFHSGKEDDEMLNLFDVTPLVEDMASMLAIESILKPYWTQLQKEKDLSTRGQRIFIARSDPAMNAGLVPAVLAVKVLLSGAIALGESMGFPVYPNVGTGSLPFRGSVNPLYVDSFLEQYAGTSTYCIQSAFRYDYPKDDVIAALEKIKRETPKRTVVHVSDADRKRLETLLPGMAAIWQPTVEKLAVIINRVAKYVPPRRERMQHIGLFGYSRGVGKVKLPRAIGFTAALYSLGIPPELIGTGRGLALAQKTGCFDLIEKYYPALRADLQHAGKYLNRENLSILAKDDSVFEDIQGDIDHIEKILGMELKPEKSHHVIHRNLTSSILNRLKSDDLADGIQADIVEAGKIRRSLG